MKDERALFTMLMNHFLLMYPRAALTNLRHLTAHFASVCAGRIVCVFIAALYFCLLQRDEADTVWETII